MYITARIDDSTYGSVHVELMRNDNEIEKKIISVKDFVDSLTSSMKRDTEFIKIGKLPYGYYNSAVSYEDEKTFKCVIIIPKGKQSVQYNGMVFSIPFPSLCFFLEVNKGKLTDSHCYAIKDIVPCDDSLLFKYPFGNVYSSGQICWGSNHLKGMDNIKELEYIITLFYSLPTNNDLYSCGDNVAVDDITLNLHGFYSKLEEKSDFPEELLIQTDKKLGMLF